MNGVATLPARARPTCQALAADLRPLFEARRLFRRPDSLAAAIADPVSARAAARSLLQSVVPFEARAGGAMPAPPQAVELREIVPTRGACADIVYLHGGGLVFHDVDLFRPVLEQIGRAAQRGVYALDYPKAPEQEPRATIQAIGLALRRYASATGRPFILAGDSIGGLLALHFALTAPAGCLARLVLIYPALNVQDECHFESYDKFGSGYMLDADFMGWFRALARGGLPEAFDPLRLTDAELDRLPPLFIASAECDVLADEAAAFARDLERRGQPLSHRVHLGMPHDFLLYGRRSACAAGAIEELIAACFA
ncbi:MAG: alpha/beta hydrolase fold domain-containing protein [Proteobacteria bacterium]|nr:alpha/beta hydrolase fold domain-containing protein [Pseudomonadota bacterium]